MKLLQQLISIPSCSGQEKMIQKFIVSYCKDIGFKPYRIGENVVVHIGGKKKDHALIFNTHVDTVPAGNSKLWKRDPFAGTIGKGKIFGLGASDEKAAVATLLLLAQKYMTHKPACDVWFTFVVNEEVDGSGTAHVVDWFMKHHQRRYVHVAAILGEPTNLAKIEIAHKGNVFVKVIVRGDSGHGSRPEAIKTHAIETMYGVEKKLKALVKKWKKHYADPVLGVSTIGFTSISAGSAASPNKFPDTCIATFDVRTTPLLHANVLSLIKHELGKDISVFPIYPPVPCGYTDPGDTLVQAFQKVTGKPIGISDGSNDLCFFSAVKIPGVVFGPGDPSCIHQANEYCKIKNIEICAKMYMDVIDIWSLGLLKA